MAARRSLTGIVIGSLCLALASSLPRCSRADDFPASFKEDVTKAGRILIGTPEKDFDVPEEKFLVQINLVLRGAGTIGKPARITNSGDKNRHPSYKAGKRYVFLLEKSDAGWVNLGSVELPVENDKIQILADGKVQQEITLARFTEFVNGKASGPVRNNLAGKWVLVMSRQGTDVVFWLVDVTKDPRGKYQARLVQTSSSVEASTLKEFSITDSEARLTFIADESLFDFQGKLDEGKVRGTLTIGDTDVVSVAWMAPTDASKLTKEHEPQPTIGRDQFVDAAAQEKETIEPLKEFVRNFPESPLLLEAYPVIISAALVSSIDPAKLRKLGDSYLQFAGKWGPRLEEQSTIELGVSMSRKNAPAELTLEYLRKAEKNFSADAPSHWKVLVGSEIGRTLIRIGRDQEALTGLNRLHEEFPFEEQLTWHLARFAEEKKDVNRAIELYAEIAVLPMMEQMVVEALSQGTKRPPQETFPRNALHRLWKEKHGDTKGVPQFADEIYEKRLKSIAAPPRAPRKEGEGNRTVLCELLTGSACPPCVGADVATTALETTYAKSEVIVLRYHQHSPAPDPLANPDCEQRFSDYDAEGTPMIYVNGKLFPRSGGFMSTVPDIYNRLRAVIDPYLTEQTSLKIDVTAKATAGKIALTAKASGVKMFPEDVRLRLVLAEDKIPFTAPNGIRFHEMIVRAMPGGPDGIEPKQGQLSFEGEVDLARVKGAITQALATVEKSMAREFPSKPLDFKAMHLVAFLQNDDTGEVLQATAIPVAGSLAIAGETSRSSSGKGARSKAPAGKSN